MFLNTGFNRVPSRQEQLAELIAPVVEAMECELWGIEYLSQGRHSMVRLYIEKPDGVGLEDCEKVSRQVSSLLDVEDPITGHYTLEVSSPGMDRPLYTLNHFERFAGSEVAIKLNRTFEQRKKFSGTLKGIENDDVILQMGDEEYLLPIDWIEKANIVPQF